MPTSSSGQLEGAGQVVAGAGRHQGDRTDLAQQPEVVQALRHGVDRAVPADHHHAPAVGREQGVAQLLVGLGVHHDGVGRAAQQVDRLGRRRRHRRPGGWPGRGRGCAGVWSPAQCGGTGARTWHDPGMTGRDVVVVGAGVVGASVALELAAPGRSVVVVDRAAGAGHGSTSASSAIVRFNYSTFAGVALAWESHAGWEDWAGPPRPPRPRRRWRAFMRHRHARARRILPGGARDRPVRRGRRALGALGRRRARAAACPASTPAVRAAAAGRPSSLLRRRRTAGSAALWTPDAGYVDDPRLAAAQPRRRGAGATARVPAPAEVVAAEPPAGDGGGSAPRDGDVARAPTSSSTPPGRGRAGQRDSPASARDFTVTTARCGRRSTRCRRPPTSTGRAVAVLADLDLGTYLRPDPAATRCSSAALEPACDPLEWLDDPDAADPRPTRERVRGPGATGRTAPARTSGCRTGRPASPASTTSRRLDPDLRPHRPARLLRRDGHQRQPVQERARWSGELMARARRRRRGRPRPRRATRCGSRCPTPATRSTSARSPGCASERRLVRHGDGLTPPVPPLVRGAASAAVVGEHAELRGEPVERRAVLGDGRGRGRRVAGRPRGVAAADGDRRSARRREGVVATGAVAALGVAG